MRIVTVALPNIRGALCSTPQSSADAHCLSTVHKRCQHAKPVEISWAATNYRTDLSRLWDDIHHIVGTSGGDIAA